MSDLRMPKGWKLVGTNNWSAPVDANERRKRDRRAARMLRNVPTPKLSDMYEQAEKSYTDKLAKQASYDKAEKEGKLWTQAQKDAAKAEKKAARKAKRLAGK